MDIKIGSKTWEKSLIKAIAEGKVNLTCDYVVPLSNNSTIRKAQLFLRSLGLPQARPLTERHNEEGMMLR